MSEEHPEVDGTQDEAAERREPVDDPLRQSRTGRVWVGMTGFAILLVLLIIFIAQNTQSVRVAFLGWSGEASLAVVVLTAIAAAILASAIAGTLRIMQLRRRVRRAAKHSN